MAVTEADGFRIRAMRPEEILVIGAGPAGLAASASLRHEGLDHVVLERESQIGSAWRRHYDRLHLHTTKTYSALPMTPWPPATPRYPSGEQVVQYLQVMRSGAPHCAAPRRRRSFGEEVATASRWTRAPARCDRVSSSWRPATTPCRGCLRLRGLAAFEAPSFTPVSTRTPHPIKADARWSWGAAIQARRSRSIWPSRAWMSPWWCEVPCMWSRATCLAAPPSTRTSCSRTCRCLCATRSPWPPSVWWSGTCPAGALSGQGSDPIA